MTLRAYIDANNGYYQVDLPVGAPDPDWAKGMTACAVQVPPAVPPAPNVQGFQDAIKTASGGIVGANALATAYPLLAPAIQQQVWPDVQALILDAHTKGVINATQYAAIQSAATANYIPITLP